MNQEVMLWLLGIVITVCLAIVGFLLLAHLDIIRRLVRIETMFEVYGEKAAKILHSPHTPQLDVLLEKYVDREYELTPAEWKELLGRCETIENDSGNPKDQRALAAWVATVAHHKLQHPPPEFKKHY